MILDALVDIESGRMPRLGSGSGPGVQRTAVMPAVDESRSGAPGGGDSADGRGGRAGDTRDRIRTGGAAVGGAAALGGAMAGGAMARGCPAAGMPPQAMPPRVREAVRT
ncbi:hypothetical protein IOD13_13495 [Brevibacterium casei]|nr:hypothetical protein [Brevibacterium casei]